MRFGRVVFMLGALGAGLWYFLDRDEVEAPVLAREDGESAESPEPETPAESADESANEAPPRPDDESEFRVRVPPVHPPEPDPEHPSAVAPPPPPPPGDELGRRVMPGVNRRGASTAGDAIALDGPYKVLGRRACASAPSGWYIAGDVPEDYRFETGLEGGELVATLRSRGPKPRPHAELNHCWNSPPVVGTKLTLRALVRAQNANDYANLHLRAEDGAHRVLERANRGFRGTFDWRPLQVEMVLPPEVARVHYGVTLESAGRVSIRQVTLEVTPPASPDDSKRAGPR